jgi:hypothetical protein
MEPQCFRRADQAAAQAIDSTVSHRKIGDA